MIKFEELKTIHIELSSACNAACPVCPRNVDGGYTVPGLITRTMSYDDFVKIFNEETSKQLDKILMCGNYGDPIFCKEIPDILEYLKMQNPNLLISIHTNGGIRSPEWWKRLGSINPKLSVTFSVDGLEDTNHIYRRGVIWERLKENMQSFIDGGGNAVWEFLIFKHNQHQIDEARELSEKMGFSAIRFKRPFGFDTPLQGFSAMRVLDKKGDIDYFIEQSSDKNFNNDIFTNEKNTKHVDTLPMESYEWRLDNNNKFTELVLKEHGERFVDLDGTEISCMTKNNKEIYIDSNGNVHPCCFLGIGSQNVSLDLNNVQYNKWLEKNIDLEKTNAKNYTVKQILETDFLSKIEKLWELSHCNGRLTTCTSMCLKNKSPRDILYI